MNAGRQRIVVTSVAANHWAPRGIEDLALGSSIPVPLRVISYSSDMPSPGPRGAGFHIKEERTEVATLAPKALALTRFLASRPA